MQKLPGAILIGKEVEKSCYFQHIGRQDGKQSVW
jgi:hypothetical protein